MLCVGTVKDKLSHSYHSDFLFSVWASVGFVHSRVQNSGLGNAGSFRERWLCGWMWHASKQFESLQLTAQWAESLEGGKAERNDGCSHPNKQKCLSCDWNVRRDCFLFCFQASLELFSFCTGDFSGRLKAMTKILYMALQWTEIVFVGI